MNDSKNVWDFKRVVYYNEFRYDLEYELQKYYWSWNTTCKVQCKV